ncbi:long-chain acyl-CoA synthetase [Desulfosalsimonas propionicica]|uniref:Long-chain acyl-CoA synthetase n=1 Tax=Desulfosalsimonas propionicica TaxID=332175 RepID=A0A7W0HM45_9BACT|nr:long-chain fatty acid--CoA ligase [Desulfosalsimonas propionicica]MBA2882980.1 long-chain acyl-CoA synthetase [Desulfosalsimonas propionicica]
MTQNTISYLFSQKVKQNKDKDALFFKYDQRWQAVSWHEYGSRVDSFAKALIAEGVKPGRKVALIGTNSLEWFIADMAIMTLGAVSVPVYQTSSGEQIEYILRHSESCLFIIEEMEYWRRIEPYMSNLPFVDRIILLKGNSHIGKNKIIDLARFLKNGEKITNDDLAEIRLKIEPDTNATFIYTSGTTGPPKAVMLSHRNCIAAGKNVHLTTQTKTRQRITCSYLPLSHVAERSINLFSPLFNNDTVIYFMRSYNWFAEDLKEIRPTFWAGVPRVWEKLYEGVMKFKAELSPSKRSVFEWAMNVGKEFNWRRYNNEPISVSLYLKHNLAHRLVIDKVLASLGLDRVEITVTGGAPTSREILNFFMSIGIWLQDVYGQTEGHGTTSFCTKDHIRFGSAGKPYPLVNVHIADDGEILIKGDNVAAGYYKDPELTEKTFVDGWLYSGDLGRFDEEGFLWITGRKKDVIITSGGKNITPSKIESYLMDNPLIEHAVVVGDGKKYVTALITIQEENLRQSIQKSDISSDDYGRLLESELIKKKIESHVKEVNQKLSRVEQIKKFQILPEPFSVEGGELTNILKVKRNVIIRKYETRIDELYK